MTQGTTGEREGDILYLLGQATFMVTVGKSHGGRGWGKHIKEFLAFSLISTSLLGRPMYVC